jgi:hypothetical protein
MLVSGDCVPPTSRVVQPFRFAPQRAQVPDPTGVHGRARTCDLRIRNPLLFRLSYVDLVPGFLWVFFACFLGRLLAITHGVSLPNAKYQHRGRALMPQATGPDLRSPVAALVNLGSESIYGEID